MIKTRNGTPLVGVIVFLLAAPSLGGCGLFSSHASGRLNAQGTGLGTFSAPMTICESGARGYFMGVDVATADEQVAMRIIQNPDPAQGPSITVQRGRTQDHQLVLNRQNCSTLDIQVQPGSTIINGVRVMGGHARFACAPPEGGSVVASVTFSNCH